MSNSKAKKKRRRIKSMYHMARLGLFIPGQNEQVHHELTFGTADPEKCVIDAESRLNKLNESIETAFKAIEILPGGRIESNRRKF